MDTNNVSQTGLLLFLASPPFYSYKLPSVFLSLLCSNSDNYLQHVFFPSITASGCWSYLVHFRSDQSIIISPRFFIACVIFPMYFILSANSFRFLHTTINDERPTVTFCNCSFVSSFHLTTRERWRSNRNIAETFSFSQPSQRSRKLQCWNKWKKEMFFYPLPAHSYWRIPIREEQEESNKTEEGVLKTRQIGKNQPRAWSKNYASDWKLSQRFSIDSA